MGGTCRICGGGLNQYNPGKFCYPCQEKIRDGLNDEKPYYDVEDMGKILGIGTDQVKRNWRKGLIPGRIPEIRAHRYSKLVIDEWLARAGQGYHKPTNPIQEEAHQLCQKGDHGWFKESKFDGIAYQSKTVSELEGDLLKVMWERICYFCGHVELGSF